MKCGQRTLTLVSLGFGLIATGALSLAVATPHWLLTSEPLPSGIEPESYVTMETPMEDYDYAEYDDANYTDLAMSVQVLSNSGLWRMCMLYEGPGVELGLVTPMCVTINYLDQDWERVSDADTTWSILRAIRKSSPVIVFSLLLMIIAFTLSTLGNTKRDFKTISGAVIYTFGALCLAIGVILYISAVNDEVSHRKKPSNNDGLTFEYHYGWAFFCAGSAFVSSMMASVTNITLYLKRYPTLEDMVNIIPGLEKKHRYDFSKVSSEDEPESTLASQNPTIIL